MPRVKSRKIAEQLIKKFARELNENNFPFEGVYLFGSYAKGSAGQWSDYDVAVVSDKFKKNWNKNENLLWLLSGRIDSRLEPVGFSVEDFADEADPLVHQIKTTGVKVA